MKTLLHVLSFPVALFCLQEALKVMEFTEEEIRDMFKLLSGVLQLGNVEFMTAGGAQITTKQGEKWHSLCKGMVHSKNENSNIYSPSSGFRPL